MTEPATPPVEARTRHADLSLEIIEADHRYYVLDDPVIIIGKAELRESVIERAARSDEKRRHMQAATALYRILLRHPSSSRVRG